MAPLFCFFSYEKQQADILMVLPSKSNFLFLTKWHLVWLRVNLTRSHVTKRPHNPTQPGKENNILK
jgi:hypothetical protein